MIAGNYMQLAAITARTSAAPTTRRARCRTRSDRGNYTQLR